MDLDAEPPVTARSRRLEIGFFGCAIPPWGEIIRPIPIERSCLTSRLCIRNKFCWFKMKSAA